MRILILGLLLASSANAADVYSKSAPMPITKLKALKTLLTEPKTKIYKCYQVQLSDKGTIVKKKKK